MRCDGTASIGLGHVGRCLALAEAIAELGATCRFRGRFDSAATRMIAAAGFPIDHGPTAGSTDDRRTFQDWAPSARGIVVDSYSIDDNYLAELAEFRTSVMAIDDFARLPRYPSDAVLNFTVGAPQRTYPSGPARLLLGPKYFLARRRLHAARLEARQRIGPIRRLLVAMGGADPDDLSTRIVESLVRLRVDTAVKVVTTVSHPNLAGLKTWSNAFPSGYEVMVQTPDLAELLSWADACVCGGGLIKYEASYLAVPAAVISRTADETAETEEFAGFGLAWDLQLTPSRMCPDALSERLTAFLNEDSRRAGISKAAFAAFPQDPARNAAQAYLELVN